MKTKNKALALVLALMLALTMCPLSGFAAGAVDELIIDDVTGSQVATAIVSDLSLPAGYTWTSSDDAILIGEEAEGVIPATVTRAVGMDKNVTLTASDGENTKEFNLVVKAKEVQIIAASSYANGANTALTNELNWDADSTTGTMIKDTDGNYYFQYDYTQTDGLFDRYRLTTAQATIANKAEIINIEYDFKYDQKDIVDLKFVVGDKIYTLIRMNKNTLTVGSSVASTTYSTGWNHISASINTYEGTVSVTLGDKFVGEGSFVASPASATYQDSLQTYKDKRINSGVSYFDFPKGQSRVDAGYYNIDNLIISAVLPTELSLEEQKEYIESLDWRDFCNEEAGAVTAITGTFNTLNGIIDWSSDNNAITFVDKTYSNSDASKTVTVGKTATVARPDGKLNTNGVITATHKDGAEYGVKTFNVSVLPVGYITDFRADANNTSKILADFEEGVNGENIAVSTDTAFKNDNITSLWCQADSTKADFEYVLDEEKGMTAKISGAGKGMWIKSGFSSDIHNNATVGMDVKFDEGATAGSQVQIQLSCAVNITDIIIRKNKIAFAYDNSNNRQWFDIDTSDWMRIDIDANLISRTNDIYVNGVKLNSVPMTNAAYYTTNSVSAQIRFVKFSVTGTSELLIDNLAVTCSTDIDASKAEAAINAAQVYYGGKTLISTSLPQAGPVFANAVNFASNGIAMNGGATLTWKENEATVTALNPTSPLEHTYTITATSGSKTITDTVSLKSAPVIINVDAEGNVTLTGNTTGGSLIVAAMDGSKLESVNVYTNFENINVSDIANYKLMFIDNFAELNPQAYSINK